MHILVAIKITFWLILFASCRGKQFRPSKLRMISADSRHNRNYQSDMKEHEKYVAGIEVFWVNHVVSRDLAENRSS